MKLASGSKASDTHPQCDHIDVVSLGIQAITEYGYVPISQLEHLQFNAHWCFFLPSLLDVSTRAWIQTELLIQDFVTSSFSTVTLNFHSLQMGIWVIMLLC